MDSNVQRMEGYKPSSKKYNVSYRQYPGLVITAKGTTLGKLQKLSAMKMTINEQDKDKIDYVFKFFVGRVITWNILHPEIELDDDFEISDDNEPACPVCGLEEGQPVPTTVEAMYCLELSFILSLIFGWMAVIASVSDPKELNFSDGAMNSHMEDLMSRLGEMQSPSI